MIGSCPDVVRISVDIIFRKNHDFQKFYNFFYEFGLIFHLFELVENTNTLCHKSPSKKKMLKCYERASL